MVMAKAKSALVVGGAGALGRASAMGLSRAGFAVGVAYQRSAGAAEELARELAASGGRSLALHCDLREEGAAAATVKRMEDECGGLDVLIYAAGVHIPLQYFSKVERDTWRAAVELDLFGFFDLAQAALPALRRTRGAIVALSTTGTRHFPPRDVVSTAPKASVEGMVRAIAREEGRYGVRANCVAPGMITAGAFADMMESEPESWREGILRSIPLRRFGAPEDIAAAVVFLASDQAAYISGQVLAVDGGWQV